MSIQQIVSEFTFSIALVTNGRAVLNGHLHCGLRDAGENGHRMHRFLDLSIQLLPCYSNCA